MLKAKVFVAGHRGLLGSATVRALEAQGSCSIITAPRQELDLSNQQAVFDFLRRERPEVVINTAAVVGGVHANSTMPGTFIGQNLMIQTNLLEGARLSGVSRFLNYSSACTYPGQVPLPAREEDLLSGFPHPSNQWYSIAKTAGLMMGQAYRRQYGMKVVSVLPCNLYGPGDNFGNFGLESSHVIPALMKKIHDGRRAASPAVSIWGSGRQSRQFLHVDDCARASLLLLEHDSDQEWFNVALEDETSIAELAEMLRRILGYQGELVYDEPDRPEGRLRMCIDSSAIRALGWRPRIGLEEGLAATCRWFVEHQEQLRLRQS